MLLLGNFIRISAAPEVANVCIHLQSQRKFFSSEIWVSDTLVTHLPDLRSYLSLNIYAHGTWSVSLARTVSKLQSDVSELGEYYTDKNKILVKDYIDINFQPIVTWVFYGNSRGAEQCRLCPHKRRYWAHFDQYPPPHDIGLVENWFMEWTNLQQETEAMHETSHGLVFRWLAQERLLLVTRIS